MSRTDFNDLSAFVAGARERSFTRAAAGLGVSQSAMSQTVRTLARWRIGAKLSRVTTSTIPVDASIRRPSRCWSMLR